jgi:hypothetical protein
MTPPSTAAATRQAGHSRTVRRGATPRASRRISGPARTPRAALAGALAGRAPLSLRLGSTAMRVGDARVLDRLVRGRAWIALMAIGLMGIVFMQVSMLRLNAGISRAVTAADTLERQNSSMRADISQLDSGERIQDVAARLDMVTPAAGDVRYLDAASANAARAAAAIKPPNPVKAVVAPATGVTGAGVTAPAGTGPVGAPAAATATAAPQGAATTTPVAPQGAAATTTPVAPQGAAATTTPVEPQGAAATTRPATSQGTTTTATPTGPQGATPATTAPPATDAVPAPTSVAGGASAPQGQG